MRSWNVRAVWLLPLVALVTMPGCPGAGKDSDPVATDTDGDTDSETDCSAGERVDFYAANANRLCAYWEGCPVETPFFATRQDCLDHLDTFCRLGPDWDVCLAAECADWLLTDPTCSSQDGATDPSCDQMVQ